MTSVTYQGKVYGRRPAQPESENRKPDATALYARSIDNRRVMFLELVAWAIREAEEAAASDNLTRFAERLQINRMRDWLPKPWPGAHKDPAQFDKYRVGLGRGFTDAGGVYPLRREDAD